MDDARERKEAEAADARRAWGATGRAIWDAARELGVGVDSLLERYALKNHPYPDPDHPGVYRVPLEGRMDEPGEALVDADTLPLIEGGACFVAGCVSRYEVGEHAHVAVQIPGDEKPKSLRRLIMGVTGRRILVAHANKDPLDCRRSNLVVITVSQRVQSTGKFKAMYGKACSSRFKGVCWDKQAKQWRVRIEVRGTKRLIGLFADEIAAARAYDEAARESFGEHAYLNFPAPPCGIDAQLATTEADDGDTRAAA